MTEAVTEMLNDLARFTAEHKEYAARETLQLLFCEIRAGKLRGEPLPARVERHCLRTLKDLNERPLRNGAPVFRRTVNLADLCENICLACDLAGGRDKRIVFCRGASRVYLFCDAEAISRAIITLLEHAVLYADGPLVTLSLAEAETGVSVVVTFAAVPPENVLSDPQAPHGKLSYARSAGEAHGGRLFYRFSPAETSAHLVLPTVPPDNDFYTEAPDFLTLLSNSLSPVQVGFCEI